MIVLPSQPAWWGNNYRPPTTPDEAEYAKDFEYLYQLLSCIEVASETGRLAPQPLIDCELFAHSGAAWAALDDVRNGLAVLSEVKW